MKNPIKTFLASTMLFVGTSCFAQSETSAMSPEERQYYDEMKFYSNHHFRSLLKGPQDVIDGMTLHPKLQFHLEKYSRAQNLPPYREMIASSETLEGMRAAVDATWAGRTAQSRPMQKVERQTIEGPGGPMEVRVYWPDIELRDREERLPVLLYLHGGGWLFGSLDAIDPAVKLIANNARMIVVSASYRQAPENKFPAAQDDALAAFRWTRDNAELLGGDPELVAIGGDSAGGQMSVVTALRVRESGEQGPVYQLLFFPPLDLTDEGKEYLSMKQLSSGFGLDAAFADLVYDIYFENSEDRESISASPLQAENFAGLPPAVLAVGGFDMLRDQGREYIKRLKADGVEAEFLLFPSLPHSFLQHTYAVDDAYIASVETAKYFGERVRALKQRAKSEN